MNILRFSHLLAFALFMVSATASADAFKEVAPEDMAATQKRMCEKTQCQHNVRVTLKRKDGSTFDKTFDVLPGIVQPIGIAILAGQTVNIEADIVDNELVNFIAVDVVTHPEKTIVAKFEQMETGGMSLSIQSPFKQTLKFSMGIMELGGSDLYKTSSCPIHGGVFEMWPEPLFQVLLTNGRVLPDNDVGICVF